MAILRNPPHRVGGVRPVEDAIEDEWRQHLIDYLREYPTITTPTLAGAWVDYGGAFEGARYWKDRDNIVHLEGLVKSGAGTIFTLDAGYRPANTHIFSVVGNNLIARIDVDSAGIVSLSVGNNAFIQLSGITFLAVEA